MHDSFIRVAEKLNALVEERLIQQLNKPKNGSSPSSKITFNRTQACIVLDIYSNPQGPNTPAKIAQRLKLESSRISHQVKHLKQDGWIVECPGSGRLPALRLTDKATSAATDAIDIKRYLEGQLRKGQAQQFDIFKTVFLPSLEKKIGNLLKPKPRRLRENGKRD